MTPPNEEQTFVHFPALGGLAMWTAVEGHGGHLAPDPQWMMAAGSLQMGRNHGDAPPSLPRAA